MKVLITGGSGFIGSHLAKYLVKDNQSVEIIVRPTSNIEIFQEIRKKIIIYKHDGTSENMMSILKESKPDIVCHLASISIYDHNIETIDSLIKSNILFGSQLIECMVKNNIYRLIITGTFWQHYENKNNNPTCLYAATKQAFENIIKFYTETTDLNVITLKLFDTYGPNDPRNKLFNFLKESINKNQTINMTPGDQLIDIVYISDIIDAYIVSIERLLSDNNQKHEKFAISSNNPIPLKSLIEKYLQITNKKADIIWGRKEYRKREVMVPWNTGKPLPDWSPKVSIEEGIKKIENFK